MAITKIQTGGIPALAVTHDKLHTTMDLSGKTVTLPTLSTLNTSGNVGIGTESPGTNLQVDGDWASNYGTMSISGPQNALTGIGLRANNTYVGSIIWRDGSTGTGGSSHLEINSYLSNPIELRTNNTARVTIDGSSGNVNIVTSLDINGNPAATQKKVLAHALVFGG